MEKGNNAAWIEHVVIGISLIALGLGSLCWVYKQPSKGFDPSASNFSMVLGGIALIVIGFTTLFS